MLVFSCRRRCFRRCWCSTNHHCGRGWLPAIAAVSEESILPKWLTLIKYHIYPFRPYICLVIVWLYSCRFWKDNMEERELNTLQPWVNNSLTLNLIVCRKRQLNLGRISLLKRKAQLRRKLNPGRISLLKRKAQHKGKRIQRKKHAKVKKCREPGSQRRASFCAVVSVLV